MGIEPFKTLERKIRCFLRGQRYEPSDFPADEKFYWHVSHVFNSVLGDGCVSITMPPHQTASVLVGDEASDLRIKLTASANNRQTLVEQFESGGWLLVGKYRDRQAAILHSLKIAIAAIQNQTAGEEPGDGSGRIKWVPTENGQRIPRMLNLGDQWTTALHRSGWGYALEPLKSLQNEHGVIFDGFLEATFCWKDSGQEYLKPWVGVIHNPPGTPPWANGGRACNRYLLKTERWANSRKNCKGIFVLSEYHKAALQKRLHVPISVIRHPTETPAKKFSWSGFENNPNPMLVQVGHWLRNPNSLYKLQTRRLIRARLDVGHPWEEQARQHMPNEVLDLESVKVIPRLDNDEYDELLATNIVFLDLLDSSANNAIIECIVRNTPVLVNRIAPVVEYLGDDYPLYFDNLKQASRKADDLNLIRQAHEYLVAMPKQQYTQEAFLHSVIQSEVYQSLLPSPLEKFVLLAHARSGSTTLQQILDAHDDIRVSYEPFNPGRERWNQHNYHAQVTDDHSLNRCLDEIYCYYTGIKHLIYQLDDRQNRILLQRNCRRIFLNRRNLFQTVVSGLIAEQTKKWIGNRQEILRARLEPLNPREVANRIDWLAKSVCRYRQFMIDHGLEFLEVKYEELYGPQISIHRKLQKVDQIFSFLGAGPPAVTARKKIREVLDPASGKINSDSTYRRIPNVDELEKQLGSRETGFLFADAESAPSITKSAA